MMAHIFVLLGGLYGLDGWVDSTGMVLLANRLLQIPGTVVKTIPWSSYQSIIHEIEGTPGKVIIVGYSGGGSRATWLANEVTRDIDLIIAYDPSPSWQMKHLPERVHKAICYYNKLPLMAGLGGGKLTGKHVETITVAEQHLAVQFDERLHEITIKRIKELIA